MQILLTHGYFLAHDQREQQIMKPYVPLGLLYISAWLEEHNIAHSVFDSTFKSADEQWQCILQQKPDILALYVNLMTRKEIVALMQKVKKENQLAHTKIILGGPEVRNHAKEFLYHGADYLVLGEGEITFHALVTALQNNEPVISIAGIAFQNTLGEVIINSEREKIKDIDILPFPNRKAVDLHLYLNAWKQKHGSNAISVSTMRGCPYTCKWCSRAVYGMSYRRRSPEKVIAEIKSILAEYNPDTIWFVDDVFTISHKWLEKFAQLVTEQNVAVKYECITRADRMNEEVIALLKRSGCFRVWIGAESGSQKIIDAMDRRVDVEQVQNMIKLTRAAGIEAGTFIMLGYPGEDETDIVATAKHLRAALPDQFTITTAYPIKGTELYTEVQNDFTFTPEWSTGSDRDIVFRRKYSATYYKNAVRYIVNSVAYAKTHAPQHLVKSVAARSAMFFSRVFQ